MPTYLVTYGCGHTGWASKKPADGSPVTCSTCRANTTVTGSQKWTP